MLFGTYAAQVTRGQIESQARSLKSELLKGNVIQPQQMFDPSLSHPYRDLPPGAPTVMREQDEFVATLAKYQQPTAGAIERAAGQDAADTRKTATILAAGAVTLAIGAVGAFLFGPAGVGLTAAASAAGSAAVCGAISAKKFKEAERTTAFTQMLAGWAEQIATPRPRIAIPASDGAQPFEYVQYVEGVMISQRRAFS